MSTTDFAEQLRESGLRVTRPRLLVLEILGQTRNHLSVDELVEELRVRETPLLRGSVYGIVEALQQKGLLAQAELGPGPARYELERGEPHCHFICTACGDTQDVAMPARFPRQFGVEGRVDTLQVVLRGLCRNCLGGPVKQ